MLWLFLLYSGKHWYAKKSKKLRKKSVATLSKSSGKNCSPFLPATARVNAVRSGSRGGSVASAASSLTHKTARLYLRAKTSPPPPPSGLCGLRVVPSLAGVDMSCRFVRSSLSRLKVSAVRLVLPSQMGSGETPTGAQQVP